MSQNHHAPDPSGSPAAHPPARPPARSLAALLTFGTASLLLLPIAWLWYDLGDPWGPLFSTVVAWCLFAAHIIIGRSHLNSVDLLVWLPVLFLLFYFGMPLAVEIMGAFPNYDSWNLGREAPRLNQAFATALLSFVAFLFGIHLAGLRPMGRPSSGSGSGDLIVPGVILMLLGLAFIVLGIAVAGLPALMSVGYGDRMLAVKQGMSDFRFINVGVNFAPAGAIALIASHRPGRIATTLAGLIGLLPGVLLNLALGDRGNTMTIVLTGGWVFSQRVRRLPSWLVVVGFSLGVLGGPIVGEFRQWGDAAETRRLTTLQLFASTFYETGTTVQVFGYTLEQIPEKRPFDYGLSVVNPVWGLVPNVTLSAGRTGLVDAVEHHPGLWVTKTANPDKFFQNLGGYAYAIGAEWYFNFGFPGVLLGMTFTGWLTARVRNAAAKGPLWLTWSAIYFGFMALLVRNALGAPLKMAVWTIVALILITWACRVLGIHSAPAALQAEASARGVQLGRAGSGFLR